jgi:hypothetical protein
LREIGWSSAQRREGGRQGWKGKRKAGEREGGVGRARRSGRRLGIEEKEEKKEKKRKKGIGIFLCPKNKIKA